ncbi:hypothetical protein [Agarivorans sp. DSG3-1]|uniref:hypothetical protein n=1 Tax=Agarivorans sp. DSG3-1 TaxID=3342249 RepID=UPI00398E6D1D
MNRQDLLENNRSRFSWIVTFCIVLLVVLLLLISFVRTIEQAEQQVVEEYTQTWVNQLAQVHGLWIARFRPEFLEVNLYQLDSLTGEQKALEPITLKMTKSGWPVVSSQQDCLVLWQQIVGVELSFEGKVSDAEFLQQRCYFTFEQLAVMVYSPQQGLITKEWL